MPSFIYTDSFALIVSPAPGVPALESSIAHSGRRIPCPTR